MRTRLPWAGLALSAALFALPGPAAAVSPSDSCNYITGFQMLVDAVPQAAGMCTEQGHYWEPGADPRDFVQHTTTGLFVRRAFNDEPGFTNGYLSWVVGPQGQVLSRLNTDQFDWEKIPRQEPVGAVVSQAVAPCIARDMNLAHCTPGPPPKVTLPAPLSASGAS